MLRTTTVGGVIGTDAGHGAVAAVAAAIAAAATAVTAAPGGAADFRAAEAGASQEAVASTTLTLRGQSARKLHCGDINGG